ncbi:MAG: tRNA (adenosine(37)-N6)-dimethylallyltransferase MiaA [Lentisphaeria bacterium]|nr:tRNA (adenosine(37)-N6)-dimethylallyltransferase MiaA [Lentisphaeria bacterium]
MNDHPLIVYIGCTASGKSSAAIAEAERLGGEIISCDSMQFYKDLPIGTAQPSAEERARVPHHLVGTLELDQRMTVAEYCTLAESAVAEVRSRGNVPILCGGTGLYVKSFICGMDNLPADVDLRKELDEKYDSDAGEAALIEEMRRLDPAGLEKWQNCRRKLIRALEVRLISGKSILTFQSGQNQRRFPCIVRLIDRPSDELKSRIRARAQQMLDIGWIDEAQAAIAKGLFNTPTAHQALGYKIIAEYLAGAFDKAALLDRLATATWQYARRQRTWFRHQQPVPDEVI